MKRIISVLLAVLMTVIGATAINADVQEIKNSSDNCISILKVIE